MHLARAVGLRSLLSASKEDKRDWANFEFIHALFERRIEIGFLVDEIAEVMDSGFVPGLSPADEETELAIQTLEELLMQTPGARKALKGFQT